MSTTLANNPNILTQNNNHLELEGQQQQQVINQQIINIRSNFFLIAQQTQDQIDQILAPLNELTEALNKFQRQMQITINIGQ